jgi:alginate O-acetyltransferase complex protein AlgI
MLFNSGAFLFFFLPGTLLGVRILSQLGRRAVVGWLVLTSLLFYGFWKPAFLIVLLGSLLINYVFSRVIFAAPEGRKKWWLGSSLVANLAALGYFKYLYPLLSFGHEHGLLAHDFGAIALPLGISFFTFTQIAYLIDLSQGEAKAENLLDYAFFVTFFPHLIAGPILHHREIMPQVAEKKITLNTDDIALGLTWFVLGLAKKSIVADTLWSHANDFFVKPEGAPASVAWIGVISYSMQLYFDFSGYSDMAVGLARMFSIQFPLNFDSPYKSTSIVQFWQRWHMTLTRYLTLYLYDPISLSIVRRRVSQGKKSNKQALATLSGFAHMVALPTLVTMLLAGIWHGAGLQYVVFGLLHGLFLTVNHAWRRFRKPPQGHTLGWPAHIAAGGLTYACVLLGQIFFRADSVADAWHVLRALAGASGVQLHHFVNARAVFAFALFPFVWLMPNTQQWLGQAGKGASKPEATSRFGWRPSLSHALLMGAIFTGAALFITNASTFLYFQF